MTRLPSLVDAQPPPRSAGRGAVVRMPQPARSDEELVRAAVAGEAWATAALLDRYGSLVERILRRVLGHDPELEDLLHDAFATVLASLHQVRDGQAVKGWIAAVAVHTAHHAIRHRRTRRWLCFWERGDDPPEPAFESPHGPRDAVRRTYAVLDQLSAEDRVVFALRYIDEMTLEEVAAACEVSLATIKRRLARAERRFSAMARRDPVLVACMEEGDRWKTDG